MRDVLALLAHGEVDVATDVAMSALTTLRVGGSARLLVTVDSEAAVAHVAQVAREQELPVLVLGRGSNLLVSDEGWPGIVLRLGARFKDIDVEGTLVRCGGAAPLPAVAVRTAQAGLGGFAWGCAVPGTIGGGLRMNAGAHGSDMATSVVEARILDPRTGMFERWGPDRLRLSYRSSAIPDGAVVTSVLLQLEEEPALAVLEEIDEIRAWRRAHQPLSRPSCGSVFTNPPGRAAGELIDEAGLKGLRIGGAEVSTVHANFIVTTEGATAADVAQLIGVVQARVLEHAGVSLTPEVVRPQAQVVPGDASGGV
jgi:UDP-N-acetylmuramate dehydrogenase